MLEGHTQGRFGGCCCGRGGDKSCVQTPNSLVSRINGHICLLREFTVATERDNFVLLLGSPSDLFCTVQLFSLFKNSQRTHNYSTKIIAICHSLSQLLFNIIIVGKSGTSHFHKFSLFACKESELLTHAHLHTLCQHNSILFLFLV